MAKEQLEIFVEAAKQRGDTLDHVLIAGPPGLGKTTLAGIISQELGVGMHTTSGPALERKVDVAGLLTNLQEGDVLFVDEIHRLNAAVEEVLYPAMEDYEIDIMIGEGPAARSIRMQVAPFTLIGATTRTGLLTTPLRDRFGVWQRLEYYEIEELAAIVRRSAGILGVEIDKDSALEIAGRSRGTPRVANRLLRRVRDFAQVRHEGVIDHDICLAALELFQVDGEGLDKLDRDILKIIAEKFDGGPVGLDTLAVALGEEADTVMDVYEPYLIMQGFLKRTPRGRVLTRIGFLHCGLKPPVARRHASSTSSDAPGCRAGGSRYTRPMTDLLLHTCCGPCSTVALPAWRERGVEPRGLVREPQHPAGRGAGAPPREHAAASAARPASSWSCAEARGRGSRLGRVARPPRGRRRRTSAAPPASACAWTRPARRRATLGFTRFSTTLTVSPYQRHDLIVAAGEAAADAHGVDFVYLDARDRFRESYAESRRLELYRQPYCGCAASKWEAWHGRRARRRSA